MVEEVEKLKVDDLIIEEDERTIGDEYEGGSESEAEEATGNISDFKALIRVLDPPLKDHKLQEMLSTARVSRIFPDNFLDKFGVLVAGKVMEQDTSKTFDFIVMMSHIQDGLSFGYEGRGISDWLEAFGVVKEQELDKLSRDLGIAD